MLSDNDHVDTYAYASVAQTYTKKLTLLSALITLLTSISVLELIESAHCGHSKNILAISRIQHVKRNVINVLASFD